jgi:hypothetical protein
MRPLGHLNRWIPKGFQEPGKCPALFIGRQKASLSAVPDCGQVVVDFHELTALSFLPYCGPQFDRRGGGFCRDSS